MDKLKSYIGALIPIAVLVLWVGYQVRADYVWADYVVEKYARDGWVVASTGDNFVSITSPWTIVKSPVTQVGFVRPSDIVQVHPGILAVRVHWVDYDYSTTNEDVADYLVDCGATKLTVLKDPATLQHFDPSLYEWDTMKADMPGYKIIQFACTHAPNA